MQKHDLQDRNRLFERHQEWSNHVWNPPYWVNRISLGTISGWRWTRKHNRINGLFGILFSGITLSAILYSKVQEAKAANTSLWLHLIDFREFDNVHLFAISLLLLIFLVVSIILFLQKPIQGEASKPIHHTEKKKKLPKRRKDYR